MLNKLMDFIHKNSSAIVTVLFFGVFCFILYRTLQKKQQKKFQDYANIPLKDYQQQSTKNEREQ